MMFNKALELSGSQSLRDFIVDSVLFTDCSMFISYCALRSIKGLLLCDAFLEEESFMRKNSSPSPKIKSGDESGLFEFIITSPNFMSSVDLDMKSSLIDNFAIGIYTCNDLTYIE